MTNEESSLSDEISFTVEKYSYIGHTIITIDPTEYKGKTLGELKEIAKDQAMENDNFEEYPYEDQDDYRVIEA